MLSKVFCYGLTFLELLKNNEPNPLVIIKNKEVGILL